MKHIKKFNESIGDEEEYERLQPKGGRCSGAKNKKRKVFQGYKLPLEFGKDYYYDKKNETNVEQFEPLLDNLLDVLVDVKDMGFDVYLLKDPTGFYTDPSIIQNDYITSGEIEIIRVYIEHNPQVYSTFWFTFKDIKDNIEHLIRYMKQELGYNDFVYQDTYTRFNENEWISNILPNDNMDSVASVIKMTFYKPV